MPQSHSSGHAVAPAAAASPVGHPAVLTALVVDDSAAARRRVATLLQLGGWRVHRAVGTDACPAPGRRRRPRSRGHRHDDAQRPRRDADAPAASGREPRALPRDDVVPTAPEAGADALEHAEERYLSALPHQLASIAHSAQQGDAAAVAAAAEALAAAGNVSGRPELAFVAQGIAHDARRGIVAHSRLMQLVGMCARADGNRPTLAGQATSR